MNRVELIEAIIEKTGVSKKDATAALSAFIDTITSAVSKGDRVILTGFGTFEPRKKNARVCRNPLTGESVNVPAKTVPAFSAGRTFKNAVLEG